MTQPTGKMPGMFSRLPTRKSITLANKMKNMRERLRKIAEEHNTYKFTKGTSASTDQQQNDPRETTSDVNEGDIVGRDGEKQEIIDLLSASDINKGTMILPIYGLGGIGKTTLASLVFNDNKFKEYDRVWVYVSQVFDLKKIGRSIISRLSKQASQQSTETMESINRCLDDLLRDKKILIVLDDIWEEKDSELEKLKRMLRVGKKGSMIDVIVTTREEVIARKISNIEPYKLQPLKEQMCWNIIKKFSDFGSKANKEQFREIGLDIAKKCGGVALAAQALGYMLKFKDLSGWSEVKDSGIWNESINDENAPHNMVLPSLKLSYKSMARHLRLCFAYCAIFPKGHNIVKYDLIHQWIALDLIKPSKRVGEEYIKQLLGMSFLQHSKLSSTSQQQAVFTMHDLVHDVARSVMGDELLVSDSTKRSNSYEQKYCRYALLTNYSGPTKLSAIFPSKVRALHFLDCSELELRNDAFSFAKCLRVLDFSGCPLSKLPKCVTQLSRLQYLNLHGSRGISALPKSIGKIDCLIHLDLSSCTMLVELPESLGKLKCLVHLELCDCSGVVAMPKSFCGLTKLQYLNLSNCSNLEKLPEAIGSLTELQYLNLSGCCKIGVLPESFRKLHNLVHLDLSNSRVEGVLGALSGLNKLQHLNISRLRLAEEYLRGLSDVLGNLTELRYLNLSRIFQQSTLSERVGNVQCISALTNLEHLDLSRNEHLRYLPQNLGNLKRLHTLDVSGCPCLRTIPESIREIHALKFLLAANCSASLTKHMKHYPLKNLVSLPLFTVHANDVNTCSNLHQLGDINCDELEICCLENTMSMEEARGVQLLEKHNLSKLTFDWTLGPDRLYLDDKDVLGELVPPKYLKELGLRGYNGVSFPAWLMGISRHLPNLVKIKLENLPRCNQLPPLGQLPNLEALYLKRLHSITKVDGDFCGGRGAFRRLSTFWLEDMERLEEWTTTYSGEDGVEEFMFPKLETLWTSACRSLRLKPCPPKFSTWSIRGCDKVISCWGEGGQTTWVSGGCFTKLDFWSSNVPKLDVWFSNVPKDKWRLLHHIPTLQELELIHCDYLASLPESMRHLTSLRSLELMWCDNISVLPEWMGDLTSLEEIHCISKSLKSLPQCVQQLTMLKKLTIGSNFELRKWCESEDNKMKLAHIEDICYKCYPVRDSSSKKLFMSSDVNTCGNLHQLEDVNLNELQICCLEDVRFLEEARKIKLLDRQSLSKLTLEWTSDDDRILEDKAVLGELVPPGGLQHLKLDGYSSISFPTWLMGISRHLPNLVKIKLENLPRCNNLPPLGQLPNLGELHLRRLHSITKIGGDFCGGKGAFLRLSTFWLLDMKRLEAWNTTYGGGDGMEFMFPKLERLCIADCPKLRLTPRPPIFRSWIIRKSDEVISSWSEGDHVSHSPSDSPGTMLVVSSEVHLPALQHFYINTCNILTCLPENMRHLASLQSLHLEGCDGISALPEWLAHLTSLEILKISRCGSIKSLPQCIQQLTKLKKLIIVDSPELKKWCESENKKMKLAHIEDIMVFTDDDDNFLEQWWEEDESDNDDF